MSGKLADPENVLVDVGARYYVEKVRERASQQIFMHHYLADMFIPSCQSTKDARTFYNQKMLDLRKSLDQLQPTIEQKNENRQVVMEYLQVKLSSRERTKPQS